MIDPSRIKHKGLKALWVRGDESKLRPDWVARIKRVLSKLNVSVSPEELDLPGNRFHELKGNRKGTYSVMVSKNWRLTFMWDEDGPYEIKLEDYHAG